MPSSCKSKFPVLCQTLSSSYMLSASNFSQFNPMKSIDAFTQTDNIPSTERNKNHRISASLSFVAVFFETPDKSRPSNHLGKQQLMCGSFIIHSPLAIISWSAVFFLKPNRQSIPRSPTDWLGEQQNRKIKTNIEIVLQ